MRFRLKRVSPLAIALVAIFAFGVHRLLDVPLWIAFGFAFLGLLINVVVTAVGDDRRDKAGDSRSEDS